MGGVSVKQKPFSSEALARGETPDFKAIKYAKIHAIKPPVAPPGNGGKIHHTIPRGQK
jgi:hypothetical protein